MKTRSLSITLLAAAALQFCAPSFASTVVTPTSDASLYICDGCNPNPVDGGDVLVAGYIQGDIRFSMATLQGPQSQVLLTLNPYALPLWGQDVAVYGYGASTSELHLSDADAGTYLGTLVLPDNLGFGQDASFDVTSFVDSVRSPYVGFDLRSNGTDSFSSLEYNYGHPAELIATAATSAVPEPTSAALSMAGLLVLATAARRRRAR